jgi:pyruvate dehydrogenase E1 component
MMPFYIYYSMFGFQRVGDFIWAAGDMQARGFLIGGTAGRTTLAGEGLQHQDGHSQLVATTIPNCAPTTRRYAYELAVIVRTACGACTPSRRHLLLHHLHERELRTRRCRRARRPGILKGMYPLRTGGRGKVRVQLLGSGTILREVHRSRRSFSRRSSACRRTSGA